MFRRVVFATVVFCIANSTLANPMSEVETQWHCVEQLAPQTLANGIALSPARFVQLPNQFVFVNGNLGWHLTWGVLLDTSLQPPHAYETYGAKGDATGAFGRMETPHTLRKAITECGFKWQGLWPNEWPREAGQKNVRPSERGKKRTFSLPYGDLLPPRQ